MWDRVRRRRAVADDRPELVVVTREGCHLCEEMLSVVRSELGPDVDVGTLDVDHARASGEIDDEQHERWTTLVPVLLVDGREVAHHRVEPGRLGGLTGRRRDGRGARRSRRFGGSGPTSLE